MLRKRNRRREGWGKSKKSDRTERTLTCMGGEMGEDKERRDRGGGECTSDMQRRRRKIKRRVRGETDTQDFPGTRKAKSRGPE